MYKKAPPIKYESRMNESQKDTLDKAYVQVKNIRENNDDNQGTDGDFYELLIYSYEQAIEIEIKKLEIIEKVIKDKDKMTTQWLNDNPKVLSLIKEIDPDILLKIEASETTTYIIESQNKYNNRKYMYIIFGSLLGIAIYPFWGGVIGFLLGYGIRYYFQPIKTVKRILNKKEKLAHAKKNING